MKRFAIILFTMAIVAACSNKATDEDSLRETARKDIIEKLELPEGTKFTDETMEVSSIPENADGPNVEYIVKVTVKSQNREGEEIIKIHTMRYKKRKDAEDAKDRFELTTIE
jgi:hypothetical protein